MTWLSDVNMMRSKLLISKHGRKLFRDKPRALSEFIYHIKNPRYSVSRVTEADLITLMYLNLRADKKGNVDLAGRRLDLGRISRVAALGWLALRDGKPTLTPKAKPALLDQSPQLPISNKKAKQGQAAVYREIEVRRGQRQFRDGLRRIYLNRCAISDCGAVEVLEAAHIVPYSEKQLDRDSLDNGLLLRADIHTLFDLHFISIDPQNQLVCLAPSIRNLEPYKGLYRKKVNVESAGLVQLRYHYDQYKKKSK